MKFQELDLQSLNQLLVRLSNVLIVWKFQESYLTAPFSCLRDGQWYREREEFREGPDGCSICLCVNTQVKCNDESCPRSTTTTTTPATTTPFVDGPRGGEGYPGHQGEPGISGIPVSCTNERLNDVNEKYYLPLGIARNTRFVVQV